jgi:hypothetical protein
MSINTRYVSIRAELESCGIEDQYVISGKAMVRRLLSGVTAKVLVSPTGRDDFRYISFQGVGSLAA